MYKYSLRTARRKWQALLLTRVSTHAGEAGSTTAWSDADRQPVCCMSVGEASVCGNTGSIYSFLELPIGRLVLGFLPIKASTHRRFNKQRLTARKILIGTLIIRDAVPVCVNRCLQEQLSLTSKRNHRDDRNSDVMEWVQWDGW